MPWDLALIYIKETSRALNSTILNAESSTGHLAKSPVHLLRPRQPRQTTKQGERKETMAERRASRALIVGGSLSGLFCGLLLRHYGWDVDIFERVDSELAGGG